MTMVYLLFEFSGRSACVVGLPGHTDNAMSKGPSETCETKRPWLAFIFQSSR